MSMPAESRYVELPLGDRVGSFRGEDVTELVTVDDYSNSMVQRTS